MNEQGLGANGGVEGAVAGQVQSPRAGRLGTLLQDLLATHGRRQTAELLGVSERTLSRATHKGEREGAGDGNGNVRLTEPLSRALQRYEDEHESELPGSGELPLETAYELASLRRRVDRLERAERLEQQRVVSEDLPEVKVALARLEASLEELRQQVGQGVQGAHTQQGGDGGRSAASVSTAPRSRTTAAPHCRYPELVTVEAEPEEERFYGAAMETIAQWRHVRSERLRREQAEAEAAGTGKTASTLDRLRADERLLQLELELVGGHGLTLPPADRPWDGIRRQSELRVLDQALQQVRRERRRARLRHWGLRLLTLGLWGLWGLLERRRRS